MQKSKIKNLNKGLSLVEMIIYIFLVSLLVVSILNVFVRMSKTYRDIRAAKSITLSASTVLNRFSYEVKQARDISGTFGVSSSSLSLTRGATTTIFSLGAGNRIAISINGVTDYLTSVDNQVTNLTFLKLLATTTSKGVTIQFTITNNSGTTRHTANFETSSILRNPL